MARRKATKAYDDDFLTNFALLMGNKASATEFISEFPLVSLSPKTIEAVHRICQDYCNSTKGGSQQSECLDRLRRFAATTIYEIVKCFDMGAEVFSTIPTMNRMMGADVLSGQPMANRETKEMVGDYMYCRPSPIRGIDFGGLRLFLQYGYPRFVHFFDYSDLAALRANEREHSARTDLSDEQHVHHLSTITRAELPAHDGSGFFVASGGQLVILSLHLAKVRCSVGTPLNRSELQKLPVKLTVSGRAVGGIHFAAKAVMFHHTHDNFGKKRRITRGSLANMLEVKDLREAMLTF